MAYFAPGQRSHTAWASTWAVEWRRTVRPSGLSAVTTETVAPSGSGVRRSTGTPSMAPARSAAVAPTGSCRVEPSGRCTETDAAEGDASTIAAPRYGSGRERPTSYPRSPALLGD